MKNIAKKYYMEKGYNCAEAVLLAANERFGLGLSAEDARLVGGFGGGLGCGMTCGALCGAMAAIGRARLHGRAHETEGFAPMCAEFVNRFEKKLGSTDCTELKGKYRTDEARCLKTVELAAELLEEYLA